MRKVHSRYAGMTALAVAAAGLVIGWAGTGAQATCDSVRQLSVSDVTAEEGTPARAGSPDTLFVFTVSSGGCATAGTADFAVTGATTDKSDLRYTRGTLAFAEGDESAQRIVVSVIPDRDAEPTETFRVSLVTSSGKIGLCDPEGIGTVRDDDGETVPPVPWPTVTLQTCELHTSR